MESSKTPEKLPEPITYHKKVEETEPALGVEEQPEHPHVRSLETSPLKLWLKYELLGCEQILPAPQLLTIKQTVLKHIDMEKSIHSLQTSRISRQCLMKVEAIQRRELSDLLSLHRTHMRVFAQNSDTAVKQIRDQLETEENSRTVLQHLESRNSDLYRHRKQNLVHELKKNKINIRLESLKTFSSGASQRKKDRIMFSNQQTARLSTVIGDLEDLVMSLAPKKDFYWITKEFSTLRRFNDIMQAKKKEHLIELNKININYEEQKKELQLTLFEDEKILATDHLEAQNRLFVSQMEEVLPMQKEMCAISVEMRLKETEISELEQKLKILIVMAKDVLAVLLHHKSQSRDLEIELSEYEASSSDSLPRLGSLSDGHKSISSKSPSQRGPSLASLSNGSLASNAGKCAYGSFFFKGIEANKAETQRVFNALSTNEEEFNEVWGSVPLSVQNDFGGVHVYGETVLKVEQLKREWQRLQDRKSTVCAETEAVKRKFDEKLRQLAEKYLADKRSVCSRIYDQFHRSSKVSQLSCYIMNSGGFSPENDSAHTSLRRCKRSKAQITYTSRTGVTLPRAGEMASGNVTFGASQHGIGECIFRKSLSLQIYHDLAPVSRFRRL